MGLNSALFARQWRPLVPGDTHDMPTYEYSCTKCGQNFDAINRCAMSRSRNARRNSAGSKMGPRKSEAAARNGRRIDLQGFGILHHRLPQQELSRGREKKEAPVSTGQHFDSAKNPRPRPTPPSRNPPLLRRKFPRIRPRKKFPNDHAHLSRLPERKRNRAHLLPRIATPRTR